MFHLFLDDGHQFFSLRGYRVEEKFVMNLQDHLAPKSLLSHFPVNSNHRELDDVRCSSLYRGIDGISLCESPDRSISGIDIRQIPSPSEDSLDVAVLPRGSNRIVNERADCRKGIEIIVNEFLGLASGYSEPLGQAE